MRTFIAIDLAPAVKRSLGTLVDDLRRDLGRQSWVAPEKMHLTLKFLGEIEPNEIMPIVERLREIAAGTAPFNLTVGGVGCFPDSRRPRVIWAGLGGDLAAAGALQRAVDDQLAALGYPRERKPFSPHVTLARVKVQIDSAALDVAIERHREARFGTQFCGQLLLMESHLEPRGARYDPLATFPFSRAVS